MIQLAVLIFVIGVLSVGLWLPEGYTAYLPGCWFQNLVGIPCPGCGLTRSFLNLSVGQIKQAFVYNAAGPVLYCFFGLVVYEQVRKVFRPGYKLMWPEWGAKYFALILISVLLGQWVFKLFDLFIL